MAYNDATNMAMIMGGMYGPNPYTKYPQGIPPTSYRGQVTDSMGKPITPPVHPGTTLTSMPAPAAAPKLNSTQNWWNELSAPSAMNPSGNATFGMSNWGAFMGPQGAVDRASPGFLQPGMQGYRGTGDAAATASPQQTQSSQQAAPPPNTSYQDAIDMLSNPGKVTTPGANVQSTQPVSNQPSVLDAFLANQKGGGEGAGGYSNASFFDTLNKLRGNLTPTAGTNA